LTGTLISALCALFDFAAPSLKIFFIFQTLIGILFIVSGAILSIYYEKRFEKQLQSM